MVTEYMYIYIYINIYIYIYEIGSGLGLYLCKNLCELMGGEINLSSIYGEGTKFIFSILENRVGFDSHIGSVGEEYIGINALTGVRNLPDIYIYIYIDI